MEVVCKAAIPKTPFFGREISRLILGDNPFNGHSYINEVVPGDEMLDFYTAETIVRTLLEADALGYGTLLPLGDPFMQRVLRQYRAEGGRMDFIFQPYPAIPLDTNIRQMLKLSPAAIYHQGTTTDFLTESDAVETLRSNLELLKTTGLPAGLGTHVPETVLRAEAEGWGADFYVVSPYNARKQQRGNESGFITGKSKELVFYPDDRFAMFDVIKSVKKPFIVIKPFAGGQVFLGKAEAERAAVAEAVLRELYGCIKPCDAVCAGVYQKNDNQLAENAKTVKNFYPHKTHFLQPFFDFFCNLC